MCKAFDDWMKDVRQEGERTGVEKGLDQMGKLNHKLVAANRIDDLLRASDDRKYRQKLMVEFGIG